MGKRAWDIALGIQRGHDHTHIRYRGAEKSDWTAHHVREENTRSVRYSGGKYYTGARKTVYTHNGESRRNEEAERRYQQEEKTKSLMNCRNNIKTQGTHSGVTKKPDRKYLPNADAALVRTHLHNGGIIRFDQKSHVYQLIIGDTKVATVPSRVFAVIQGEVRLAFNRPAGTNFIDYTEEK